MKTGLILMTALPPTKGHQFLIDFARAYLQSDFELCVIVSGREHEPIPLQQRVTALEMHAASGTRIFQMSENMPQEPKDHPQFWDIWKAAIENLTGHENFDFVFASEEYGKTVAALWDYCLFVPCNIYRETLDISGTKIRNDPLGYFDLLHPQFQQFARKTITIFGPESVGKTTLSKKLSTLLGGYLVPEWAREYLEMVAGPEITDDKMAQIVWGQRTLEQVVNQTLFDRPFIIRDTDLLSTYGYYRLWKGNQPVPINLDQYPCADLYIFLNESIPFTPDPLRYGGDKRESDNKYWKQILIERDSIKYYEIQSYSPEAQLEEAAKVCRNLFYRENNWKFER